MLPDGLSSAAAGSRRARDPLGFDVCAKSRQHDAFERVEIVAEDRLARGDRDLVAAADGQNAAPHGADSARARRRCRQLTTEIVEHGQEIRMAVEDAETAALILGAHASDIGMVDDDGESAW